MDRMVAGNTASVCDLEKAGPSGQKQPFWTVQGLMG